MRPHPVDILVLLCTMQLPLFDLTHRIATANVEVDVNLDVDTDVAVAESLTLT